MHLSKDYSGMFELGGKREISSKMLLELLSTLQAKANVRN